MTQVTGVTTLTSKGQVTVPKAVRDALGLKPRDKVEIFVKDGTIWLRKAELSFSDGQPGGARREQVADASLTVEGGA